MRIAMIGAKGLPGLQPVGGGIEAHVEELALHLVALGHKVTVYVRTYANPQGIKAWQGIDIVTLPSWHTKNLDTITHVFLASLHAITERFDVVHYHGVGPSTLCWLPRLFKRRSRVIVTFHSRDQYHEKWSLVARMFLALGEWTAVTLPHATIAVSHAIQLFCEQTFGKRIHYIPNGVNVQHVKPGTDGLRRFKLEPGKYFLQLARLIPLKAQDDTIRAFRALQGDMKLVITGSATYDEAKYAEHLKQLAKGDGRIVFTGYQRGPMLKQLIAHCRAMIHPSRTEGLALSILEAMSFGKLVIMSDIKANLELIDHSGIAVPVGDVAALTLAMQWAMDNPQLTAERGERGKEIIQRLYAWPNITQQTIAVYKRPQASQ